jgi:hypothetical protein
MIFSVEANTRFQQYSLGDCGKRNTQIITVLRVHVAHIAEEMHEVMRH